MRVISKFHDYYDNIGYHSKYPVFVRQSTEYTIGNIPLLNKDWNDYIISINSGVSRLPVSKHPVYMYVIGFCGKLYFIYNVVNTHINYKPIAYTDVNKVLEVAFNGNKKAIDQVKEHSRIFRNPWLYSRIFIDSYAQDIQEQFNSRFCNRDLTDLFLRFNSPIFVIPIGKQYTILTVNPVLKDYGFQHIIDTFTTHQKVEMYISNILVSDKDVPEFDDTIKRDMHGMDNWSFKKRGKKGE
jgi:hypothetical protein